MSDIAILVLAAGKSSRMKTPKQLLQIKGKTMLQFVLEKAIEIAPKQTFCTLGNNYRKIKEKIDLDEVSFIHNSNYSEGISESIKAGLHYFNQNKYPIKAVLILLGDQPAIEIEYLENLIKLWKKNPCKIIASSYHSNPGVPAIFPNNFWEELEQIEGDKGAKKMMLKNQKNTILSTFKADLTDIDTLEEYQNYINQLNKLS